MASNDELRADWPTWVPLAFVAYALWRITVLLGKAIPAWQQWHAGAHEQYAHEHEYHFWQSSSSVLMIMLLPLPLLMTRVSNRARWALYALWGVLMIGSVLLDRRAEALRPY